MPMSDVATKISAGGRIVIPADFRRELGADVGDEVILRLVDGEIHVLTKAQAVRKAQALVRRSVAKDRSLVKELLQERRKEAKRE
jgi:AbrB family looped-hinge helix DNA binding protein